MFESLKKKFSGTIGKISEQLSSEEEEAIKEKESKAETTSIPDLEVGKKRKLLPPKLKRKKIKHQEKMKKKWLLEKKRLKK